MNKLTQLYRLHCTAKLLRNFPTWLHWSCSLTNFDCLKSSRVTVERFISAVTRISCDYSRLRLNKIVSERPKAIFLGREERFLGLVTYNFLSVLHVVYLERVLRLYIANSDDDLSQRFSLSFQISSFLQRNILSTFAFPVKALVLIELFNLFDNLQRREFSFHSQS